MEMNGMKLTDNRKPTVINPITERRMKLVNAIDNQLNHLIGDEIKGGKWYWLGEDGCIYVEIRYGKNPLELKKGLFSIQCLDESELITNLNTIKSMVKDGKFDNQLASISKSIRSNFTKK